MATGFAKIAAAALTAAALLSAGCANTGRYVLLKEYQASVAQDNGSALRGKKVFVEHFIWESNLPANKPQSDSKEPPTFDYVEMTAEQKSDWSKQVKSRRKGFVKNESMVIGNVRNGFGMTLSNVYALSDPGQWLKEAIELEAANQGAVLAATAADADLVVSGKLKWLMADLYMKIWSNMVTEVTLTPRSGAPVVLPVHTGGIKTGWTGSDFEYYTVIRQGLQKFMLVALPEMANTAAQ